MSNGCDSISNKSSFGLKLCIFKCMMLRPLSNKLTDGSDEKESDVLSFGPGLGWMSSDSNNNVRGMEIYCKDIRVYSLNKDSDRLGGCRIKPLSNTIVWCYVHERPCRPGCNTVWPDEKTAGGSEPESDHRYSHYTIEIWMYISCWRQETWKWEN